MLDIDRNRQFEINPSEFDRENYNEVNSNFEDQSAKANKFYPDYLEYYEINSVKNKDPSTINQINLEEENDLFSAKDTSPSSPCSMSTTPVNHKNSDDFKVKYKTEVCRLWEMNRTCKYGDNVILKLYKISVLLPTAILILNLRSLKTQTIELKDVISFSVQDFVNMVIDVNIYIKSIHFSLNLTY